MMNCFKKKKPKLVKTSGAGAGPQHTCCCCCRANGRNQNGGPLAHGIPTKDSHDVHLHVPHTTLPPSTSTEDGQFFSKRSGTVRITDSDSEKGNPCYAWMMSQDSDRMPGAEDEDRGASGPKEKAYMPVSKDDPHYNMTHPKRGKAVIFNFDHWDNTLIPELGLSPRKGSAKDKNDLGKTLERLDFDVHSYESCGSLEMWDILYKLRDEDHSAADCLVVCIMTHGERNTVFVRDGTQIPVNLIWETFEAHKCPSLAGKPKIFIIQACRGKSYDSGTVLSRTIRHMVLDESTDVTDSATFSYVIPNTADFLIAFSCPLGHYSWRNPQLGSWFIQSICKIFDKHAYDMDIQHLFTAVARDVALNYESNTTHHASDKKKQVTSTSSTLIRKVIFTPKQLQLQSTSPPQILNGNVIRNGGDEHRDEPSTPTTPSEIWTESQF